ncbi:MAG: TolC family protein [Candidatus Aminicenantes bacterium]|nr:TolC family protein [Candidatus Aminicenantes bacterium]
MKAKSYWLFILTIFLVLAGLNLSAQETVEGKLQLTLDDCLKLALEQNPFYLSTLEKENEARAQVHQAAAGFLPSINAQGTDILDKKVFTVEIPSMVPGQPPQRVKFDFTRTYQMSLNFSFPLFTGGRLTSGYRQASYNYQATQESIKQARQETILNVKQAFYGYLLARKFLEVAEESVNLAEKHLKNVRNLVEVGMATKFDLLRAEVQLANLQPQLIRARNGLQMSELALKNLLGLDLNRQIEIKGELAYQEVQINPEEARQKALLNRPEIHQLGYQRRMAGEMIKLARASDLPTVAIGGQINFWSNYLNFRKNNWENYYTISLALNIPIFNGFASQAQAAQAKALARQLDYTMKGLTEAIKLEVDQAILNYQQAREALLSQQKNVDQAAEAVRLAELNFSEGLATTLDVTTAQVALSQARTNYAQALYECLMALANLEKATGESISGYMADR